MPNENFGAKFETWAGETHNTDEAHRILVCEKKQSWQILSPKNVHVYLIFFVNGTPGLLGNIAQVTDLWVINAKNTDGYDIETMCFVIF